MNRLFASYVTGSAFRLDLSRRMVTALLSAAEGKSLNTGHYGVSGLIERGIMEITKDQDTAFYKDVRLTDVGMKVVELCKMAGLEAK
jgi:hypothetical protein